MMPSSVQTSALVQRIAYPLPASRQARADVQRHYAAKKARIELRKMQERMAALTANQQALRDLTEVAAAAAPNGKDGAAWPTDISELADKIRREEWGMLEATETPVRSADREIVLKGLPPCVEVNRDDVRYTQ